MNKVLESEFNCDSGKHIKLTYHNPLLSLCETTEEFISNSSLIPSEIIIINSIVCIESNTVIFKQKSVPIHTYSI